MEQRFSSELSPQPSRPEHTTALERHLPLEHRKGQCPKLLTEVFHVAVHDVSGSSEPSSHEITALQNSYSGKQRPSSH